MSLMDLFETQGEVGPSPGSSRGNLKDWFLNMRGRRPFGRTARPDPNAKRGDWIDWFLNRSGFAGKFGGNERYKYDSYNPYDYQLFQRGGLVNPHEETAQAAREWSPREQRFNDGPPSQMNPPSSDRLVNDYFTPSIDGGISNVSNVNDRSIFQAQVNDNPLTHFNPFRQFIRQASLNRLASKHGYQGDVDAAEEATERANYGQTNNPLIPDVDWGNRNIEWNFPYGKGTFDIRFGPDSAYFGWGTS